MTPDEAIAIIEARDGEAVQYTLPLKPVNEVLVAEIKRLREQRECLLQFLYDKIGLYEAIPKGIIPILDEVEGKKDHDSR